MEERKHGDASVELQVDCPPASAQRRRFMVGSVNAMGLAAGASMLHPLLGGGSGTARAAEVNAGNPHERLQQAFRLRMIAAEEEHRRLSARARRPIAGAPTSPLIFSASS